VELGKKKGGDRATCLVGGHLFRNALCSDFSARVLIKAGKKVPWTIHDPRREGALPAGALTGKVWSEAFSREARKGGHSGGRNAISVHTLLYSKMEAGIFLMGQVWRGWVYPPLVRTARRNSRNARTKARRTPFGPALLISASFGWWDGRVGNCGQRMRMQTRKGVRLLGTSNCLDKGAWVSG